MEVIEDTIKLGAIELIVEVIVEAERSSERTLRRLGHVAVLQPVGVLRVIVGGELGGLEARDVEEEEFLRARGAEIVRPEVGLTERVGCAFSGVALLGLEVVVGAHQTASDQDGFGWATKIVLSSALLRDWTELGKESVDAEVDCAVTVSAAEADVVVLLLIALVPDEVSNFAG